MTSYVRREWSDVWHWIPECSHFPDSQEGRVVEDELPAGQRPSSGELCNQCRSKERKREAG